MNIFEAILQGIIQGITEFLPVSSDGHLSLFQHFFGLSGSDSMSFTIFLHVGTLIAVCVFFFKPLLGLIVEFGQMIADIFTGKFKWKAMSGRRRMLLMMIISLLPLLLVYVIKDSIESLATDSDIVIEGLCFLFSGLIILISSRYAAPVGQGKRAEQMRPRDALIIGVLQGAATLPGLSRSGSTISGGLMLGYEREYAFEYSFLLGTPAILAATAMELKDVISSGESMDWLPILIGMAVAAVVGYVAVRLLAKLVKSGKFKYFGWYCIVIGVLTLGGGIAEHIVGKTVPQMLGFGA